MLASMLCTIHNERYTVRLVDRIRDSIEGGYFDEFKAGTLGIWKGRISTP
jgi:queuine tRNA-ribosyltransferase